MNLGLALALGLQCGACSGTQGERRERASTRIVANAPSENTAPSGGFPKPARVFPAEAWAAPEPRALSSGLRTERLPEGGVLVATDLVPGNEELQGIPLPERLGGGFLFVSRGQQTSLWRAASWTAPLNPLATVEMRVERIEPGFDRLYLIGRRETRALDVNTGEGMTLGPVPPAASYRELRFGDAWTALAEVPVGGVLATFDGGQQWWPVEGARAVVDQGAGLFVTTDAGVAALEAEGTLTTVGEVEEEESEELERAERQQRRRAERQRELLRQAVLRGLYVGGSPQGEPRALVVFEGALALVSLSDARLLWQSPRVVGPGAVCQGVRLGKSAGFVCRRPDGGTLVAVWERETWRELARFPEARAVVSVGAGGVLLEGPCAGRAGEPRAPGGPADRVMCRVGLGGSDELRGIPPGALPVVTSAGVSLVQPPTRLERGPSSGAEERAGDRGEPSGAEEAQDHVAAGFVSAWGGERRPLRLPDDEDLRSLLVTGQWLGGGSVAADGRLAFWVAEQLRFAGVRVDAQGRVEVGSVQKPVRRALLSARFGLLWGAAGFLKETVDGGFTWREAALPYRTGDADPTQPPSARTTIEAGCSAAGCVLGPWIRVGWNDAEQGATGVWQEAPVPPLRLPPAEGVGRWRLRCQPSGRASRPFVSEARSSGRVRAVRPRTGDSESSAAWQPFWEWSPPRLEATSVGYSLGAHLERARLYTWGPREGSWGERGRMQVAFANPFTTEPVLSTPTARPAWPDARRAAVAFGDGGQTGFSHLHVAFDPTYHGGLGLLRSASEAELYVFEDDRPPVAIRGALELGLNALEDAVKVGETWFTTQRVGTTLRILRVRGGHLEEIGSVSLGRGETPWARLVRSVSGDHLGLWVEGGAGRVVYSVDPNTATLGAPTSVPRLGRQLRVCSEDVEGYLLVVELSPPPSIEVRGTTESVDLSRVTGQLVVGGGDVCVSQLSASTRDPVRIVERASSAPRTDVAVLTVTEQRDDGRRWEMICQ